MESDEEYAFQLQIIETIHASTNQSGAASSNPVRLASVVYAGVPSTLFEVPASGASVRFPAVPAAIPVSRRSGKGVAQEHRKEVAKKERKVVAEEVREGGAEDVWKGVPEEVRGGDAEDVSEGVAQKASGSDRGRRRSGRGKEKRARELEDPGTELEWGNRESKSSSRERRSIGRGKEPVAEGGKEALVPSRRTCEICMQVRSGSKFRGARGCDHTFCVDCMSRHVEARVNDGQGPVRCPEPECAGVIGSLECGSLRCSKNTVENLERLEVLSCIPEAERFYCPFRDCSAMMCQPRTSSSTSHSSTQSRITSVECFSCNRLFCAECKVPWHADLTCKKFQRLVQGESVDAIDAQFRKLVTAKKWRECPNCMFVIELSEGCIHMTCRCGYQFCYVCGRKWESRVCSCVGDAPMGIPVRWR